MFIDAVLWSIPAGLVHFIILGALYGNPFIDKIFAEAQNKEPGVRRWESKPKYLITQFLGTQVEVIIIVFAYIYLRDLVPAQGMQKAMILGGLFSCLRIYPRFWNMWIQSTYPMKLLGIEVINGIIGTLIITNFIEMFI